MIHPRAIVRALRETKFTQITGRLHRDKDNHCALGVLYKTFGFREVVSAMVQARYGENKGIHRILLLNDKHRRTFKQIAYSMQRSPTLFFTHPELMQDTEAPIYTLPMVPIQVKEKVRVR